MAQGRIPTPSSLRLVTGTHRNTRHGDATTERSKAERIRAAFGPLKKPTDLKGEGAKAWKRWIEPATWLDGTREAAAIAFCELWNEFRVNPMGFPAAKHTQMRGYMAELGLTEERSRPDRLEDDDDEFFN